MSKIVRHTAAERDSKLEQAEALIADGATMAEAARAIGVQYGTLYQWRMRHPEAVSRGLRALRRLERENAWLRRRLATRATG